MTEKDDSPNNKTSGRKQFVRGKFPRLPLKEVLELPKVISAVGQGEPVRRITAFDKLGRSPESSTSRTLITASSTSYGLTKGGTQAQFLELTDVGRSIIEAETPSARRQAEYDVLFGNDIFTDFVEYWQDKVLPVDEIAIDWLTNNQGLPNQDAQVCWGVMKRNILDFNLTQESSGKLRVLSREIALQNAGGIVSTEDISTQEASPVSPASGSGQDLTVSTPAGTTNPVTGGGVGVPQMHFNIQIHMPENGSPEVYDAIFKSIGTYLLGRTDD